MSTVEDKNSMSIIKIWKIVNPVLLWAKKGLGNEFSCSIEVEKLSYPQEVKKVKLDPIPKKIQKTLSIYI